MNELPDMDDMFLETKGYQRFEEFCDACVEYKYIGRKAELGGQRNTFEAKVSETGYLLPKSVTNREN